jgi:hypothetical protein
MDRFVDFSLLESCPKCGSSWQGAIIPPEQRESYGGKQWFSRVLSLYSKRTDASIGWKCPDCGTEWSREGKIRPNAVEWLAPQPRWSRQPNAGGAQ